MKNFKNNPVQFLFFPTVITESLILLIQNGRARWINPDEVRNRRVQLFLTTPSLYERLSRHCRQHRISINSTSMSYSMTT